MAAVRRLRTVRIPTLLIRRSGSSTGKQFEGRLIADRFITSGSTGMTIKFVSYIEAEKPKIYLLD